MDPFNFRNYDPITNEYKSIFPTDLALRPKDLNTLGKQILVRINQYKVLDWPQGQIYQYDVMVGSGSEKPGKIRLVWNSPTVQKNLRGLDSHWLFDGNRIAWCMKDGGVAENKMLVDIDELRGRTPKPGKEDKCRVVIKRTKVITMAALKGYLDGKMAWDNTVLESINLLDHVLRQFPSEQMIGIKRSFYTDLATTVRHSLDTLVEAQKGVYASMRLCSPTSSFPGGTGLAVNVDVANTCFWIPQLFHQAARNMLGHFKCKDYLQLAQVLKPRKNENGRWEQSECMRELRKFAKVKFIVRHRGKENETRVFTMTGFAGFRAGVPYTYGETGATARTVTFEKDGRKMTVEEYFKETYNIKLACPHLPLLDTAKDGYFPMELASIKSMQRYSFKLSPDQTAKMIKFAVTRPKERLGAITTGVQSLKWGEDPYMHKYGVRIDPNMTVSKARLLPNPEIQFAGAGAGGKLNPGTSGRWDLRGKKFLKSNPEPLKSWAVVVMDECVTQAQVLNFMQIFIKQYIGHGGNVTNKTPQIFIPPKSVPFPNITPMVKDKVEKATGAPVQILLYILKEKNSFFYERCKKANECRFGFVSQMMHCAHIVKAQPQYCSNVCMKLNAKLGGTTSRVVAKSPMGTDYFKVPTLIIGADVSHASPGSPQPSMAAVTMSMDMYASRYAAAVQTNGYRVEMITSNNIRTMVIPLLKEWIATLMGNKGGPSHIYYMRDGVSEGQYNHVLQQEVADIKKAIEEEFGNVNMKFTVIVCSKRHHIRFFPKDGDHTAGDRNANPLPGTLVEHDVTHPFENDFYLSSHSAIQGTARPVHYQVLLDEMKVPTNILHGMIYAHCYQYMRSTTPVSLHPAIYYAHLASNRARAHENTPASLGPRGGQKFMEMNQDRIVREAMAGPPLVDPSMPSQIATTELRHTEAPALVALGSGDPVNPCSEEIRRKIRSSMWYI